MIEQKISDALYRIKGEGRRSIVVHCKRLKPCFNAGPLGTDPIEDELERAPAAPEQLIWTATN